MVVTPKNFAGDVAIDYTKTVELQPGQTMIKLVKTIQKPELWWTWDFGKPNLYTAEFTVGDGLVYDQVTKTIGLKKVEHDYKGNWYLNGKRVFLRGMRYLSSLWIAEMNEQRYREDLAHFPKLNINSVRIGSHVEMDVFYDICDEMGLLLWQVFPMHYCYSDSDLLIEQAAPMMTRDGADALQSRLRRYLERLQRAEDLRAAQQAEQLRPSMPDHVGGRRYG